VATLGNSMSAGALALSTFRMLPHLLRGLLLPYSTYHSMFWKPMFGSRFFDVSCVVKRYLHADSNAYDPGFARLGQFHELPMCAIVRAAEKPELGGIKVRDRGRHLPPYLPSPPRYPLTMGQYWMFLNVDQQLSSGHLGKMGEFFGIVGLDKALFVVKFPPSKLRFKAITVEGSHYSYP
jgi:hypothetical protein